MDQIDKSEKTAIKMLKREAMKDVRSITGNNFRRIMLLMGEDSFKNVNKYNVDKINYYKVKMEDMWKVKIATKAIDLRDGYGEIATFKNKEIKALIQFVCVS